MSTGKFTGVVGSHETFDYTGRAPIAFAAGDIKAALERRRHTVQIHDLVALAQAGSGKKIVLAVATDKTTASMLSARGSELAVGLGEKAYAIRTSARPLLPLSG